MSIKSISALVLLVLSVTGCATFETSSRDTPLRSPVLAPGVVPIERSYDVQEVVVVVPETLRVSETNGFYPFTDIVWRGDPVGDRHKQVADLFEIGAVRALENIEGTTPVVVNIEVERFHGVTERTRFSVGGVYHMVFFLQITHAETGAIIEGPRRISYELAAPGGRAALELIRVGQTERVRVTDFLAFALQREFGGDLPPGRPEQLQDL